MSRVNPVIALLLFAAGGAACGRPGKEASLHRGNALSADGKWTEALAEYRKALEIDQEDGEARARLADALEQPIPATS